MIGIDCTTISRWQNIRPSIRQRMADHFGQPTIEPKTMAKWWACHEAILKAVGYRPTGEITFPKDSAPQYKGKERVHLSLTHEGDLVIAIALLGESECKKLL